MKALNLINNRGNAAANQIVIIDSEHGTTSFQSYDSLVAVLQGNTLTLGRDWDYSKTTMKHLHIFMNDYTRFRQYTAADIRKAIADGAIKYDPDMR